MHHTTYVRTRPGDGSCPCTYVRMQTHEEYRARGGGGLAARGGVPEGERGLERVREDQTQCERARKSVCGRWVGLNRAAKSGRVRGAWSG